MSYLEELRVQIADDLKDYYAEQRELHDAYLEENGRLEQERLDAEEATAHMFDPVMIAHDEEVSRIHQEIDAIEEEWDRLDRMGRDTFSLSEELQDAQQRLFDAKERYAKYTALSNSGCAGVGSA